MEDDGNTTAEAPSKKSAQRQALQVDASKQVLDMVQDLNPSQLQRLEAAIADAKNPNKCESAPALQDSRATMQPEKNQLTTIEPAQHAAHSQNEFRMVSKHKWEDRYFKFNNAVVAAGTH